MTGNCHPYLLPQINTAAGFDLATIRAQARKLAQASETCKTDVCNAITDNDIRRAVCCTAVNAFDGQSDCPIPGDESYAPEIAMGVMGFYGGLKVGEYRKRQNPGAGDAGLEQPVLAQPVLAQPVPQIVQAEVVEGPADPPRVRDAVLRGRRQVMETRRARTRPRAESAGAELLMHTSRGGGGSE